jgi:eukaryotic-like serine/threonine-protein kinase
MAEVFKAKSFGVEGFEKVLVIKRILPELAKSKRFADMFVHEAKLAVRLSHANVVQVFDLGTVEDGPAPTYYIAMEYVAGLDLATLLAHTKNAREQLPLGMCAYIAGEVAKGLDHAHRRRDEQLRPLGIVHRDVSPQNILISWEGEVKVADFGIAKARGTIEEGVDAGTPPLAGKWAYMSPEQASGEEVDARSDLFSLGVVLYELVTGVNPFRAEIKEETLRRVRAAEYPPVDLVRQDVPGELSALVEKALSASKERRFADAGRMYESLLAFLYGSGDRFGGSDLAGFVSRFRRTPSRHSIHIVADESLPPPAEPTPVEVPTGSSGRIRIAEAAEFSRASARAAELGERREVTALVVGLGDGARPSRAERGARVRDLMTRYGGHLLEEEPAQITALFGLGEPDARDTETAVRCALVVLRQMTASPGSEPPSRERPEQAPSAGVHAGPILIGRDGAPQEDERLSALVGAAAQMAALREHTCGITLSAARNVRGLFVLQAASEEGSKKPKSAAGLLVSDSKVPGEGLGRFFGRKEQLRQIGEILSLATRRRAHVVTLSGERGIGVTRFLLEIERRLKRGSYRVAFYTATCLPNGTAIPLSGVTVMLQILCGIKDGDPVERILAVEPRLRALGLHDEEVGAVLGQLGAPGQPAGAPPTLPAALARMVVSLCSDQLHVFAWDNAHALDPSSAELIQAVLQKVGETSAVFLFAGRDSSPSPFADHPSHRFIHLGELGEADIEDLVADRAAVRSAPPELVTFCRERAGGHPQFIEELIKELVDSGALVVANGAVVELSVEGAVVVPRSLRALLASRVARLPEAERQMLQAAAILDEPVDLAVLAAMLRVPLAQIEKTVTSLEGRSIVRRTGNATIAFGSPMFAEVLIDILPTEARREMHASAGAAYEEALGERAIEYADRMALQFHEAGDHDRAAGHYAQAAQRKLAAGRYEEAAREFARALELSALPRRDPSELSAWLSQLAAAVYRARTVRERPDMIDALLLRIDAGGTLAVRVGARIDLASILVSTHDFDGAERHLEAARSLAGGDAALAAPAILTEAELARRRGDYRRAMDRFEELKKLGTTDEAKTHRVLMGLAISYAAAGDKKRALEAFAGAEKLAPPDDAALASERAKLDQLIAFFTRDFSAAAQAGQRAVELARRAGLTYEVAINQHVLGEALFRLGELPLAYASFQQSSSLCEEISEDRLRAHNRSFLAYLDAASDPKNSMAALSDAIAFANAHRYSWDEVNARYLLACIHRDRKETKAARAEFERCRELAHAVGFRLMVDDCAEALTKLD